MTEIAVSRLHFPVTTLGPGRRVGLWVQGCSIACPGCISPDTWAPGRGMTTVDAVTLAMDEWMGEADGLTVSGGEPFEQPQALAAVLRAWHRRSAGSVLVFTGLAFEAIGQWLAEHPGLVDAVVAGPFRKADSQTLALRGSDNQTMHLLTPLGRAGFAAYERAAEEAERRLDVMFDDDGGAWFAGIPARGDFERLRAALRGAGHQVRLARRGDAP